MVVEIIVGVAVVITAIVSLVLCVCGKTNDKYSRSVNRAEDNNNIIREVEVAVRERDSENPRPDFDPNKIESVRPKTLTINRKLPEIPHSDTTITTELIPADIYATVDESTKHNKKQTLTQNSINVESTSSLNTTKKNETLAESFPRSRPSSVCDRPAQQFEERHNYAKIKGLTLDDRDTDTDTYCDPQLYTSPSVVDATSRSFDLTDPLYEQPPPPVPEKYFELGADQMNTSMQSSSLSSSAASAIAGNPSIGDIPFMTSPVPSNQNLNYADDSDTYLQSNNVMQEIRYTSISVREPLANIRAQMTRPIPAPTSSSVSTSGVIVESHYSIVPEDVDQTYAEIESAQHSTTSSMNFNRINTTDGQENTLVPCSASGTNYPPAPPTVESLRTVAQAHSRHASSSSCISDNSHQNSPATDRSFDLNDGGGCDGRSSASPDFSAIYSVVDKSKKLRSTVHIMEDESPVDGSAYSNGNFSISSIEDMYAKVTKNRPKRPVETGARPKRPNTIDMNHLTRQFSAVRNDPGYEKIRGTEQHNNQIPIVFEGVEVRKKYTFSDFNDVKPEQVLDNPTSYPNYETIKDPYLNGGVMEDDQESENGYEKVRNPSGFSRSDPNYESVRYGTNAHTEISDVVIDDVEAASSRWTDALYERINGREDDDQSDPNYEKVKTMSESSNDTCEPGYEKVKSKRKLFQAEDGYERIRERDRVVPTVSRKPATEPGYESIKDRANDLLALEDNIIDDELYSIPTISRNGLDQFKRSERSLNNEESKNMSDL